MCGRVMCVHAHVHAHMCMPRLRRAHTPAYVDARLHAHGLRPRGGKGWAGGGVRGNVPQAQADVNKAMQGLNPLSAEMQRRALLYVCMHVCRCTCVRVCMRAEHQWMDGCAVRAYGCLEECVDAWVHEYW